MDLVRLKLCKGHESQSEQLKGRRLAEGRA